MEAPGVVAVRDVPEPAADDRAVVGVHRAGICGTDVKILHGGIPTQLPRVLGHELVGTVVRAGPSGSPPEGSRVLVDPSRACGTCRLCLADRGHLCTKGSLLGRDVDGGFAEYVAVEERQLHVLPDAVAREEAPVLQVLGTCVHAQTLVDVFPGQTAVVVGLGVSGLLHAQLLGARGVTVVGVGRTPAKLELARTLGIDAAVTPDEAGACVDDLTQGAGADLVVESVGSLAALRQGISLAGVGATVLAYGTITERSGEFPYYELYYKELDIRASRAARPRDYARAIALTARGVVRLAPLVTSVYSLGDAAAALEACGGARGELKIMIDID
ncbi:MAG: zinc-dependent alcohol dehydrogenase [Actinomycetes bacterium]